MISDVLKARRLELNKRPSDIPHQVGVSESTYRDWEHGRKIQGEPYKALAEALEMNILDLLEVERADHSFVRDELNKIEDSVKMIRKFVM